MSATNNIYGSPGPETSSDLKKAPDPIIKSARLFFIFVMIVVVALILLKDILVITEPNEFIVVQQFGQTVAVTTEPGLIYKLPFIQAAHSIPRDIQLYDLLISDVITKDKKSMVADSFVLWRVNDPAKFIKTLDGSVKNSEALIGKIVCNAMQNVIGNLPQIEIISGRDKLADYIFDNIGASLDEYGVTLVAIETKHLDLPAENRQAVYERMISEYNSIAAVYKAEGDSEAAKIQIETDKVILIQLSLAQAEAERIIAEGEAESMRILAEAYSTPERAEFYSFVRSLDAAKESLKGGNKTLVLSKDSPIAELFPDAG